MRILAPRRSMNVSSNFKSSPSSISMIPIPISKSNSTSYGNVETQDHSSSTNAVPPPPPPFQAASQPGKNLLSRRSGGNHSRSATAAATSTVATKKAIMSETTIVMPKLPSTRKTAFSIFRNKSSSTFPSSSLSSSTIAMTKLMNQFPQLQSDEVSDFFLVAPNNDIFGKHNLSCKKTIYNPYNEDDYDLYPESNMNEKKSIPFVNFIPIRPSSSSSSFEEDESNSNANFHSSSASTKSMSDSNDDNQNNNKNLEDHQSNYHHQSYYYDNECDMEGYFTSPTSAGRIATATMQVQKEVELNGGLYSSRPFSTLNVASGTSSSSNACCTVNNHYTSHDVKDKDVKQRSSSHIVLPFRPKFLNYATNYHNQFDDDHYDTDTVHSLESGMEKSSRTARFDDTKDDHFPSHLYLNLNLGSTSSGRIKTPTSNAAVSSATHTATTMSFNETITSYVPNGVFPPFKKRRVSMDIDDITLKTDTTSVTTSTHCTLTNTASDTDVSLSTNAPMTIATPTSSFHATTTATASTKDHVHGNGEFHNYDNSQFHILQRNDLHPVSAAGHPSTTSRSNNDCFQQKQQIEESTPTMLVRPVLHAPTPVYANKSARGNKLYKHSVHHALESFNADNIHKYTPVTVTATTATMNTPTKDNLNRHTFSPKKKQFDGKMKNTVDNSTMGQSCDYDYNNMDKYQSDSCDDDVLLSPRYINKDTFLRGSFVGNESVLGPPVVHRTMGNGFLF